MPKLQHSEVSDGLDEYDGFKADKYYLDQPPLPEDVVELLRDIRRELAHMARYIRETDARLEGTAMDISFLMGNIDSCFHNHGHVTPYGDWPSDGDAECLISNIQLGYLSPLSQQIGGNKNELG